MGDISPKKLILFFFGLIVLLLFFIAGYSQRVAIFEEENISSTTLAEDDVSIWVINDLHYLASTLTNKEEAFVDIAKTAAGKEIYYQKETVEAFIWKLEQTPPDYLLVNGDLTLNGERESFEELQDYFEQIEGFGTEVFVNPGNHDISNGWARSFIDDRQEKTATTEPDEFVQIFKEHGYDDILSKDPASLSYVQAIRKDYWIVMIDSNQYAPQTSRGPAPPSGRVREETINWLQQIKKLAQEYEAEILPVMHHNLLKHNSLIKGEHQISNAEQVGEIWETVDVKVALTAHLHAQNIQKNSTDGIFEIATGAVSIYPSSIGEINVKEDSFSYNRTRIPVVEWATEKGLTDTTLLNFPSYKKEVFMRDGRELVKGIAHQKEEISTEKLLSIKNFVAETNTRFFSGQDSLPKTNQKEYIQNIKENPSYQWIEKNATQWLLPYLDSILFEDTIPDDQLLIH